MSSFGRFHVEVANALLLPDCGVLRIGEGTLSAVAEAGEVVLVSAKILRDCSEWERGYFILKEQCLFLITFQITSSMIIFNNNLYTIFNVLEIIPVNKAGAALQRSYNK